MLWQIQLARAITSGEAGKGHKPSGVIAVFVTELSRIASSVSISLVGVKISFKQALKEFSSIPLLIYKHNHFRCYILIYQRLPWNLTNFKFSNCPWKTRKKENSKYFFLNIYIYIFELRNGNWTLDSFVHDFSTNVSSSSGSTWKLDHGQAVCLINVIEHHNFKKWNAYKNIRSLKWDQLSSFQNSVYI